MEGGVATHYSDVQILRYVTFKHFSFSACTKFKLQKVLHSGGIPLSDSFQLGE